MACVGALAIFWPGFVGYDAAQQYAQALSGRYVDWHPPIMARLWAVLLVFGDGAGAMLAVQMILYWLGAGLVAITLAGIGRACAAVAVLALAASPLFLGWQVEVVKDAQMSGALFAAIGLIATWRLRGEPIPLAVWPMILLLLLYATLLRGNAIFATIPIAMMLIPGWSARARIAVGLVAILATIILMPMINQRLFHAEPTTIQRSLPKYDLAGIWMQGGAGNGLTPAERAAIRDGRCYKAYFWDPLGHAQRCGPALRRLDAQPLSVLTRDWVGAIVANPVAYLRHRLYHLNSTDRWIVPRRWLRGSPATHNWAGDPGIARDVVGTPNPSYAAYWLQVRVALLADTPFCWPICWIILAVTSALALRRAPETAARSLALLLLASALATEASFVFISIASPLRYHLWPMMAIALAFVLVMSERAGTRRIWISGGIVMGMIIAAGLMARAILPLAPTTFTGTLTA